MPLKAILESLDEIEDEGAKALYVEQDGKFVLDVDDTVEQLPRIASLRNAYTREKEQRKAVAERAKALEAKYGNLPEDFDPSELDTLREAAEAAKASGAKGGEQAAKVREQLEKKFTVELQKAETEKDELRGQLRRLIVDGGLDKALDAAGIAQKFKPAARALLKERGLVKLDDGFEAIVETDMGPTPVAQFVRDWAASDEGRAFVAEPVGAGANGSSRGKLGEPNPYSKAHWNKTNQGQMLRNDPAKAERLAKAAGFADITAANKAREALA